MAQNLIIKNKEYDGVEIFESPKAGGGKARFYDTSDANAAAAEIASGKRSYGANGAIDGTMTNIGYISETIDDVNDIVAISQGFTNGGSVTIDSTEKSKIVAENIKSGVEILGVTGSYAGGSATLGTKTISNNGTYNASSDNLDGYSQVTVSVPASAVDTGTKNISTNGTHDVIGYANAAVSVPASAVDSGTKSITSNGNNQDVIGYAAVNVNVPNTYSAGDEGKVVSSGALVSQTAHADVTPGTSDQTIDTTTNNSLKVKGDADLVATNIKKDVEIFGVTGSYEGGGGGIPYLTYWGTISVFRQGAYAQPTFPVVPGRCVIAFCPDERIGSTKEYVMLFATYNSAGTNYSYGAISEEDGRSISTNYSVTAGAEYMTPSRYTAFNGWMDDYTITNVPTYLITNTSKDEA